MKKYIYVKDGKAFNILPEFDPIFPGVPIDQRYSPEFLSKCAIVDEDYPVEQDWDYFPETNTFKKFITIKPSWYFQIRESIYPSVLTEIDLESDYDGEFSLRNVPKGVTMEIIEPRKMTILCDTVGRYEFKIRFNSTDGRKIEEPGCYFYVMEPEIEPEATV